jgi:hypothetical protein
MLKVKKEKGVILHLNCQLNKITMLKENKKTIFYI